MKIILFGLLLLSALLNAHFYRQFKGKEKALQCYESKQSQDRDYVSEARKSIGEMPLAIRDSIVETHRIWSNLGRRSYVLRIEILKDSSIQSFFKEFTLKNPLTQEGETAILVEKEGMISTAHFYNFKKQLSQIKLDEAAINGDDIMCCFGGGTIVWEAKMTNGESYEFRTFCRKSVQFAEACERLLAECGVK